MRKPQHVFDREREWAGLVSFASDASPGARLGVVSGRRRQGKSYLLQALAITFYQAIMVREWARLERGDAATVWRGSGARFLSQVVGPHVEVLCREYALDADGAAGEVGSGVVPDPANRTRIEVDVAVLAPVDHGRPRRVLSLGEVKWDRVMGAEHVARLRRARDLLTAKGYDTRDTVLTCYSGAGFTAELGAGPGGDVRLVTLDDLYA
ncbi:hypothetical protein [Microbispora sp. NBC_01389]|uniref:hypothetical protein n=1 Tax=Microbispora sp. NBC_01389 TaxID=2903584 RepID=UPI0032507195